MKERCGKRDGGSNGGKERGITLKWVPYLGEKEEISMEMIYSRQKIIVHDLVM